MSFKNLYVNSRADTIYNWSGINRVALRSQVIQVKSEEDIVKIVKGTKEGQKALVSGSRLSFEPISSIPEDEGSALIDITNLEGLISINDTRATFWAGTKVYNMIKILGNYDKQLPASPGVIGIQTLSGAICTGTHGQGLKQSSYGDMVVGMRVVLPSGEILIVGEFNGQKASNDIPLDAFTLSLGILGVITQITIQIVPRKVYSCKKFKCPFEEFKKNYIDYNMQNEYVKCWWFPETDLCQIWIANELPNENEDAQMFLSSGDLSTPRIVKNPGGSSHDMSGTVSHYLQKMGRETRSTFSLASLASDSDLGESNSSVEDPQFQTVTRFMSVDNVVGHLEQIFCKGIPVPQINCEISIPLDKFDVAINDLKEWSKTSNALHYPFIFRATGKSQSWLSQSQRESVQIGALVYLSSDGCVRADGMQVMYEFQKILAKHSGIPHFGKHFVPEIFADNLNNLELLPNVNSFFEIRKMLDPSRKMMSPFWECVWANKLV